MGVFDHDAALKGKTFVQGKAVSPLLRRSATALHKSWRSNSISDEAFQTRWAGNFCWFVLANLAAMLGKGFTGGLKLETL
jgi:hypothetical protein